jgi:hypothetical protein
MFGKKEDYSEEYLRKVLADFFANPSREAELVKIDIDRAGDAAELIEMCGCIIYGDDNDFKVIDECRMMIKRGESYSDINQFLSSNMFPEESPTIGAYFPMYGILGGVLLGIIGGFTSSDFLLRCSGYLAIGSVVLWLLWGLIFGHTKASNK